ncbi:hypothetical protein [Candidatus Nitrospira neomarina]|uniref:Uncharacterized protein n=1 Tax=Candidatus Nitrospira neomarina TaxID=3020899 RepID=A0AA96JYL6_9BACT|nr:hypothetical protein [Candidatus Nitrospira neomarina]WNM60256.1 hypothetical protein PQG83_10820 [Candidatus Nitrospira neomarina]
MRIHNPSVTGRTCDDLTTAAQSCCSRIFPLLTLALAWTSGCAGPSSLGLETQFEKELNSSSIIQEKLSIQSQDRLPAGMVIVMSSDHSRTTQALSDNSWLQFAARVKQEVQNQIPLSVEEVIRLEDIPSGNRVSLLDGLRATRDLEVALILLTANQEITGPAQLDLLPEVSRLNGQQTENHATIELGLLDIKSGKLLLRALGRSHATLEQLDVPLASNRYPRVRGSAMTSPIYPEEGKALETVRMIALHEALDQAVMKLAQQWTDGVGAPTPSNRTS